MNDMFLTEDIRLEIARDLFTQWVDIDEDGNLEEAEHAFMKFASDEIKVRYNNFYGLTSGDEFFLEVTD